MIINNLNVFLETVQTEDRMHIKELNLSTNLATLDDDTFQALCKGLLTCPHLETLNLMSCNLDALNIDRFRTLFGVISRSPNLSTLHLGDNNLGTLDADRFQILCDALASCPQRQTIGLHRNNLGALDTPRFLALCNAFSRNSELKTLTLLTNDLTHLDDPSFQALCDLLPHLEGVGLGGNDFENLSPERFALFCEALSKCTHLQVLDFSFQDLSLLDDTRFQALCLALSKCINLQDLDLLDAHLGACTPERFQLFCKTLSELIHLRRLSFAQNDLGRLNPDCLKTFFDVLINLRDFKALNLSDNDLHNFGIERFRILKDSLVAFPNLEELQLEGNYLGRLDAERLSIFFEILLNCPHLSILGLQLNNLNELPEKQFITLMETLAKMLFLRNLNFADNGVDTLEGERLKAFCDMLAQCLQLQALGLCEHNQIDDAFFKTLCNAFKKCRHLQSLNLAGIVLNTAEGPEVEGSEAEASWFEMFCRAIFEAGTVTEVQLNALSAAYNKMLTEILIHNKFINDGFKETFSSCISDAIPLPAIQSIIVEYVLPAYALSKAQDSKTFPLLKNNLEKKWTAEGEETKENSEYEHRKTIFRILTSPSVDLDMFQALLQNVAVQRVASDNLTLLLAACQQKDIPLEVIKALLVRGSNPNDTLVKYNALTPSGTVLEFGGYAFSCVDLAVINGREDIIRLFMNNEMYPITSEILQAALRTCRTVQHNSSTQSITMRIQQALDNPPAHSAVGKEVLDQIAALERAFRNTQNKDVYEAITTAIIELRTRSELTPTDIENIQNELNRVLHSYGSSNNIIESNLERIRRCINAYENTQSFSTTALSLMPPFDETLEELDDGEERPVIMVFSEQEKPNVSHSDAQQAASLTLQFQAQQKAEKGKGTNVKQQAYVPCGFCGY